jgi:hypothetical protein
VAGLAIKIDSYSHFAESGECEEMLKRVKRCDGRFILYEVVSGCAK